MSTIINKFSLCDKIPAPIKQRVAILYAFDNPIGHNVLFITDEDLTYGVGDNGYGVLGLCHDRPVPSHTPALIPELCHQRIHHFYSGENYALALTQEHRVFSWGQNNFGQLGAGGPTAIDTYYKPQALPLPPIVAIACGDHHSLALTVDGQVYGWGRNNWGQVGCGGGDTYRGNRPDRCVKYFSIGDQCYRDCATQLTTLNAPDTIRPFVSTPVLLDFRGADGLEWHIKCIACAADQSFAITAAPVSGLVFGWGLNDCRQTGHPSLQRLATPQLIPGLVGVRTVCPSERAVDFLTDDGQLWFCGKYMAPGGTGLAIKKVPEQCENGVRELHSLCSRLGKTSESIVTAIIGDKLYRVVNSVDFWELNVRGLRDFYAQEYQLSLNTIHLNDSKCGKSGAGFVDRFVHNLKHKLSNK